MKMTGLGKTIAMAFDGAARAEAILADGRTRRALRDDPERLLATFEFHRPELESAGVRLARAARRYVAVSAAAQLRRSGSAL
jgi:hypothetical protein